jgi:hypothetical protein
MALSTTPGDLGRSAPDFDLPGTDGRRHTRDAVRGHERSSGEHAQWQSSKPVPAVIRAKIARS